MFYLLVLMLSGEAYDSSYAVNPALANRTFRFGHKPPVRA